MALDATDRQTTGTQSTDSRSALGRRGFLRATGVALAATVTGTGAAAAAEGEEYRTITLGRGEVQTRRLGDGDVFENVLIDQTASGAKFCIKPNGSDWAIRNVAWKGTCDTMNGPNNTIVPSVDSGSTGVIENVYLGDGAAKRADRMGGMWVNDDHAGTLVCRNVHVAGWQDNGLYGSGPGKDSNDGHGVVIYENCYGKNNRISNFRLGTDGSYAKGCVSVYTASPGGERPFYTWHDDMEIRIEDCDIYFEGMNIDAVTARKGIDVKMINCQSTSHAVTDREGAAVEWGPNCGRNPDPTPPAGVPMTPVEAASGAAATPEPQDDAETTETSETTTEGSSSGWSR